MSVKGCKRHNVHFIIIKKYQKKKNISEINHYINCPSITKLYVYNTFWVLFFFMKIIHSYINIYIIYMHCVSVCTHVCLERDRQKESGNIFIKMWTVIFSHEGIPAFIFMSLWTCHRLTSIIRLGLTLGEVHSTGWTNV